MTLPSRSRLLTSATNRCSLEDQVVLSTILQQIGKAELFMDWAAAASRAAQPSSVAHDQHAQAAEEAAWNAIQQCIQTAKHHIDSIPAPAKPAGGTDQTWRNPQARRSDASPPLA